MRGDETFLAVDWGTTNRRAYLLSPDGGCTEEFEDELGVLAVEPGGFPAAVRQIRDRLGDHPMLLAGMIGSNRGWVEAPYVPCPAGLAELAAALVRPQDGIAIVPGISFASGTHGDVMRGEEIQMFGAVEAGLVPDSCIVCHPGTHNKWIRVEGGEITSFRTVMTGELFNLLKERSILSDLLARPVEIGEPFRAGVRRGLADTVLTAELFSARAAVLLGLGERDDAASFVSGLLIGADLRAGLAAVEAVDLYIMGRPELTALYAAGLAEAGRGGVEVDGERAFVAGARAVVERMS